MDSGPSTINQPPSTGAKPLRTWPALALVAVMIVTRFGPALLEDGMSNYWMVALLGPMLCCLLIVIWWVAASRATRKERLFGFLGLAASLGLTLALVHPTMRGPGTFNLTLPMGLIAFALGAVSLAGRPPAGRTGSALFLALVGFGFSLLLRNEGMTGDYGFIMKARWSQSPEDSMLATRKPETSGQPVAVDSGKPAPSLATPEWPGFRGVDQAGRSRGPKIATDWTARPPRQLWKIPVGPAWSSFAVAGNLLFTQEQRGPKEAVVCYDAATGQQVWIREMEARLDDPLGGPGPRATPTLANGGLFATGATGIFLRLDPATGDVVWQQDLKSVAGREAPMWGFSTSPLIAGSVVIVYAGGPGDKGVLGFDVGSGELRWSVPAGNDSYASPQRNLIAGENLVLMLTNAGLLFIDPATGKERFNYAWKYDNYRALQPNLAGIDTLLLPTGIGTGTRAIRITSANGQLAAEELWTSPKFNPDFTDFVSYQGYAYGVVGGSFACTDLKTGERKWKGGRYGKGQVLLLEDSGLLLVAAEQGQVVLLRADPGGHAEVASFQALEGKTWNHPVVVGNRLYLRNSQEAAAYELPLAEARDNP